MINESSIKISGIACLPEFEVIVIISYIIRISIQINSRENIWKQVKQKNLKIAFCLHLFVCFLFV